MLNSSSRLSNMLKINGKKDTKNYFSSETLTNVSKLWLTVMLFVIPFQAEIMNHIGAWSERLSIIIRLLDEITIIIFTPLAIREFYKEKIQYQLFLIILLPLGIFSISALLSGVINDNSLFVTGYGIFYYIKYFFLIFIYAAFFNTFSEFSKIFRYLLLIAVIVGFVAFIHEVWAIIYHYALERIAANKAVSVINSLFSKLTLDDLQNNLQVRLGFYRTTSLMSHFNLLGFYSLIILTIYLYTEKKVNPFYFLCLLSGIYFSMSRVAIVGFTILALLQVIRGRKWLVFFIIIPVCALFYFWSTLSGSVLDDSQDFSDLIVKGPQTVEGSKTYRQHARRIALDVWKDHPNLGVGPGMFGGAIAIKTGSPYYEEYNFSSSLLNQYSDLDQFWPQALAETGITGTVFFATLYLSLFVVFFISRNWAVSYDVKNFAEGLIILTMFIIINTFASSLNIVSILYPYCALAGMGLGSVSRFK